MSGFVTHRDPRALAGPAMSAIDPVPPAVLSAVSSRVRVAPGGSRRIPLPLAVPAPPPQPRPAMFEPSAASVTRTAVFPPPMAFPSPTGFPAQERRVTVVPASAAPASPQPAVAAPVLPPPDLDALAARLLDPLMRTITARQRAERDRRDGPGR